MLVAAVFVRAEWDSKYCIAYGFNRHKLECSENASGSSSGTLAADKQLRGNYRQESERLTICSWFVKRVITWQRGKTPAVFYTLNHIGSMLEMANLVYDFKAES